MLNSLTKRNGIAVHMMGPIKNLLVNNENNNKVVGKYTRINHHLSTH